MEATLKVTVDLGETTKSFLSAFVGGGQVSAPKPVKTEAPAKTEVPAPVAKTEAPAKVETPKAEKANFADLDDDAKLEAIKTEVIKHTKKGKSADIKALLTHFDAGRASELAPEVYGDFYNAIQRYGKGETVEAITGGDLD